MSDDYNFHCSLLPSSGALPHTLFLRTYTDGSLLIGPMLDSIKFTHSTSSEHMGRTSESDDLKTSKRERLKEKAHDVGHSAKESFKSGEFSP